MSGLFIDSPKLTINANLGHILKAPTKVFGSEPLQVEVSKRLLKKLKGSIVEGCIEVFKGIYTSLMFPFRIVVQSLLISLEKLKYQLQSSPATTKVTGRAKNFVVAELR